jgi:hypothetical protein
MSYLNYTTLQTWNRNTSAKKDFIHSFQLKLVFSQSKTPIYAETDVDNNKKSEGKKGCLSSQFIDSQNNFG